MAAEACACGGRIWLDGVALVEKVLIVELLKQPPQTLYILVIVGDVRVLHVNPIAHLVG